MATKKSKAQQSEEERRAAVGIESLEDHTARLKEEMRAYNDKLKHRRTVSAQGEAGLTAGGNGGTTTVSAPAAASGSGGA